MMHEEELRPVPKKRKPVPRSARFEVFKRDKFTCQYCGAKAPDVILHVDHVDPAVAGGSNDISNLVTACVSCNLGKGPRKLSDDSAIKTSQARLEELQARREQLEMMLSWKRGLANLDSEATGKLATYWSSLARGFVLNHNGLTALRKLLRQFGADAVTDAMNTAAAEYLTFDGDGNATADSWEKAWSKVGGICFTKRNAAIKPWLRDYYYVRAIVVNNTGCRAWEPKELLEMAFARGATRDELRDIAASQTRFGGWLDAMMSFIDRMG